MIVPNVPDAGQTGVLAQWDRAMKGFRGAGFMKVFVYGTLMRGRAHHGLLREARFEGRAVLDDYALYRIASFPGIAPCAGCRVRGEVYGINGRMLRALDNLECEGSMFLRREVVVWLDDGSAEMAYAYEWNGAVRDEDFIPYCDQPWGEER